MNGLVHNIRAVLGKMIDTNTHTLKGEFGKKNEEYCRQHSKNGDGNVDFSEVPYHCSYEIAVDAVEKTIEHLKNELNRWA